MPEIAEVRWLAKNLQFMVGATINDFTVKRGECVLNGDVQFTKKEAEAKSFLETTLKGAKILNIGNIAKFTLFETTKSAILTHLGFTGWWIPEDAPEHRPRKFIHTLKEDNIRLILHTDKGLLKYLDPRLLGRNRIYPNRQSAIESRHLRNMAPEADSQSGLASLVRTVTGGTRRRIKDVIMDQKVVSGIGNYLACEMLFEAQLHGGVKANTVTPEELSRLLHVIPACIKKAETEDNRDWWRVFQRAGEPCFRCGQSIVREVWQNRGNYTCLTCQKPPDNWKEPGKSNATSPKEDSSD